MTSERDGKRSEAAAVIAIGMLVFVFSSKKRNNSMMI